MAKITIFGLAGTGKTTAGKMLAEKLGYDYKSTGNIFRALAEKLGMTLGELEAASMHTDEHDKWLDSQTKEYGETHDNFVFESRLAWHFIPDSIKIHLYCDFDTRVGRVAQREGKDFDLAKMETLDREEKILHRYKEYYGIENIEDPNNFDLNIDTEVNNAQQVVDLILGFIKENKK